MKKAYGFTIVELLIVIAVISILALISVVTYNGLRGRAESTAAIAAVRQAAQKVRVFIISNGSAPTTLQEAELDSTVGNATLSYTGGGSWCISATTGTNTTYRITSNSTTAQKGECYPPGLMGVYEAPVTVHNAKTVVFVGKNAGTATRYGFDFRPQIEAYLVVYGESNFIVPAGPIMARLDKGLFVSYSTAPPSEVRIGRRYSDDEAWNSPFRGAAFDRVLSSAEIETVIDMMKAELQ